MPAWHTSPFSEYITYYAFANKFFPRTVRIYDEVQMGASYEEIAANYYMGNGLGVSNACHLTSFAASSPSDRAKHPGSTGYCHSKSGKRVDACEFYKPERHGGKSCPAPKYESYHGFRNVISPGAIKAFEAYDLEYFNQHTGDTNTLRIIGAPNGGSGRSGRDTSSSSLLHAPAEDLQHDAAMDALDKKIRSSHGNE